MRVAGGQTENGVVFGNTTDKYGSRNPIVRRLMRGWQAAIDELVDRAAPTDIHDVGCGEGFWVERWHRRGIAVRGSDASPAAIAIARDNARAWGIDADRFAVESVYRLPAAGTDLAVCCEVLEHLDHPAAALAVLAAHARRHVIISVPREPIWRLLNLARGKYALELGNTPGHVQHWSTREIVELIGEQLDVVLVRTPLPWTVVLARVDSSASRGTGR